MNKEWVRKTIREFEPYKAPEMKEKIIINANEGCYNIFDFPAVKADFLKGLAEMEPYRYPSPFAEGVRQALGDYLSVKPEEILCGNGGDEIIQLILNAFIDQGDTVLVHTPTFDIYGLDAEVLGAKVVSVPDLSGFKRDVTGILKAVKELQPKVTFICNPNNPTGELWPLDLVEQVLQASQNIVVVDEAYLEFTKEESILSKLDQYDNLVVIKTLSKAFGMAGLRLGYCVAQSDVIDAISLTKAVYNLNGMTQLAGEVVLAHRDEILAHNVPPILEAREFLIRELNKLPGLTAYPSVTNFFIVRTPDGVRYDQALRQAGIAVRSYGKRADLSDCLRISVTTMDVAKAVLAVFAKEAAVHA